MIDRSPDPYQTLGVTSRASDAELRAAYRRLAQLHHPDHNACSAESAQRFEAVQRAYAQIRALRATAEGSGRPRSGADPDVESRLADLERELEAARAARERARKAAREAAETARDQQTSARASDEELGYITTEDSFSKILADAVSELSEHLQHEDVRRPRAARADRRPSS
ncbi:MAG: J domain-containing protein [Solirubrobacteraceae bacterium]